MDGWRLHDVVTVAQPGVGTFSLGVFGEVFGYDRSDAGLPRFDYAVVGEYPGPVRSDTGLRILPDHGLGIALKITDGATRAAEAAITALLVHLGALPEADPVVERYLTAPIRNWRGRVTGQMRRATAFPA